MLARDKLAGALNVRTREPREFAADEVELLSAIAGQVGQAIENAKLYERSQRRVAELEALAEIAAPCRPRSTSTRRCRRSASARSGRSRPTSCALVLAVDERLQVGHRTGPRGRR